MLLIGAGLMVRTLWNLQRVDPGFQTERVLTTRLDLNFTKYDTRDKRLAFHEQLLRRLQSEQGVVSVAISGTLPVERRRRRANERPVPDRGRGAPPSRTCRRGRTSSR